nr:unnamed protein product [Digitaria exilis]
MSYYSVTWEKEEALIYELVFHHKLRTSSKYTWLMLCMVIYPTASRFAAAERNELRPTTRCGGEDGHEERRPRRLKAPANDPQRQRGRADLRRGGEDGRETGARDGSHLRPTSCGGGEGGAAWEGVVRGERDFTQGNRSMANARPLSRECPRKGINSPVSARPSPDALAAFTWASSPLHKHATPQTQLEGLARLQAPDNNTWCVQAPVKQEVCKPR